MKIIKLLVVVVSVLVSVTTQASVVKTLEVSGAGSASGPCDFVNGPCSPSYYSYTPTQAILDSSGVLSFTITGNSVLNTRQIIIQGVFGDDGLFTPQSDSSIFPGASRSSISAVSPYEIQETYVVANLFVAFWFADNFTFSEVCPAINAPAGCGGPIFAPAVPLPASMWLFSSGLLGLITTKRRRQH